MTAAADSRCPMCAAAGMSPLFVYTEPPRGETVFPLAEGEEYHREVMECRSCGHMISRCPMDLSRLYERTYSESTYGRPGIAASFNRILSLDAGTSDNEGRVRRVCDFARTFLKRGTGELLDVGSGLGVFPYRMSQEGWAVTALEPDENLFAHIRDTLGLRAIRGTLDNVAGPARCDAVSLNKVLEHVPDPVRMLVQCKERLRDGGFVYLEVPDGQGARESGSGREEFFIEHLHVFSEESVRLLAGHAGMSIRRMEAIREPSTKFTIYAFLATRA